MPTAFSSFNLSDADCRLDPSGAARVTDVATDADADSIGDAILSARAASAAAARALSAVGMCLRRPGAKRGDVLALAPGEPVDAEADAVADAEADAEADAVAETVADAEVEPATAVATAATRLGCDGLPGDVIILLITPKLCSGWDCWDGPTCDRLGGGRAELAGPMGGDWSGKSRRLLKPSFGEAAKLFSPSSQSASMRIA